MAKAGEAPITYDQLVNYAEMDPAKVDAQAAAATTSHNLRRFGYEERSESRGESVQVWDEGDKYRAGVLEGLGTKNLVAEKVDADNPDAPSTYKAIAQDTIAMIVNDLVVCGAEPQVLWLHVAAGESEWFTDKRRISAFNLGCAVVCNELGIDWFGGESPTLPDVIVPGAAELSGFILGEINPKDRYVSGDNVQEGDAVVLVESSGIHANGLTAARKLATTLPEGYATELADGSTYGEALLRPTILYHGLVKALLDENVEIHRTENITGHGWRKLMRGKQPFTYRVHTLPPALQLFSFMQEQLGVDDTEMFGNYNMNAGFAFFVPRREVPRVIDIAGNSQNLAALDAGVVEAGPKMVVIEPKNVTFDGDTLGVR